MRPGANGGKEMKRSDYELFIKVEENNAGSVSDFGSGMEIGAISMLKHIISIDFDLEKQDKEYLLSKVERARAFIRAKSEEVKREYESKSI